MKWRLSIASLFLFVPLFCVSQDSIPSQNIDSLYREDQIYFGINVNFLNSRPEGVVTESLVGGFGLGFLRDMPINEKRNIAIAVGLGYAYNSYGHNLFVGKNQSGESEFFVLDDDFDFDRNSFETHEVELPIELRWRTSTPQDYKFWRIYGGLKLGYVFYFKSVFKNDAGKTTETNIDEFEKFRYTAFLNFGYDAINFQVQYNINSFFSEEAKIDGTSIDMTAIKLGVIFYIL